MALRSKVGLELLKSEIPKFSLVSLPYKTVCCKVL